MRHAPEAQPALCLPAQTDHVHPSANLRSADRANDQAQDKNRSVWLRNSTAVPECTGPNLACHTIRLSDVKSLNLWGQDLGDISLLTQLPAVEVLSLSVNSISSLKDFSSCLKLQELYLRKNEVTCSCSIKMVCSAHSNDNTWSDMQIADVSEVSYLARLPDLRVLWLSDNPCAQDPNYRAKACLQLRQCSAVALRTYKPGR